LDHGAVINSLTDSLEQYMNVVSLRQKVVASNIANADTPGYKTQGLDFQSSFLAALDGGSPRATEVAGLPVKNDGNNVDLDRAALLVENIANSETTRTAGGGPYRRKDAIFSSDPAGSAFASELDAQLDPQQLTGVKVVGISVDSSPPEKRYLPGHPDADADGYVSMPKVNAAEDMVDLMSANRSYQANVSAMSAVKDMIQKSIDLLR
jgi:flagellar basal-body rod protein FlgC